MNKQYQRLAAVFAYPDEDYPNRCRDAGLNELADRATAMGITAMQELFSATFDWNPEASLDLSWHLYGEQYARGEFLVRVRELLRSHGVAESAELPDHITHILALFARMRSEPAREFARDYAAPAIAKLVGSLEQSGSVFASAVRAVREALPVQSAIPVLKTELPVLKEEGQL